MINDRLITNKIILSFKTAILKITQCVTNANNKNNTVVNSKSKIKNDIFVDSSFYKKTAEKQIR
jgi:hypothetical protein